MRESRYLRLLLALTLGAALLAGCAGTDDSAATDPAAAQQAPAAAGATSASTTAVTVSDAWMPVPSSPDVARVFLTITNDGAHPVRLVGGTTDLAGTVEVHETVTENGRTAMRPLEDGLVIPAGGHEILQPGATHLMLRDLHRQPTAGEQVRLELDLGPDGRIPVEVTVRSLMDGNTMGDTMHDEG